MHKRMRTEKRIGRKRIRTGAWLLTVCLLLSSVPASAGTAADGTTASVSTAVAGTCAASGGEDEVRYADGEAVETLADAHEAMDYAGEVLDDLDAYDEDGSDYQTKRILVKTDGDLTDSCGADAAVYYESLGMYILTYETEKETEAALKSLQTEYGETAVFTDQYLLEDDLSVSLTDGGSISWGTDYMNLSQMRDNAEADTTLNRKVTVAVLDTGINTKHELFTDRKILKDSANFVNLNRITSDIEDDCGHGSHVAGIIANSTSSNIRFLSLKVLNENGEGSVLTLAIGIDYINTNCDYVDIINISAGVSGIEEGSAVYDEMEALLKKAYKKGMFIVAASGNGDISGSGTDITESATYPANSKYAVSVGSINKRGKRAAFSNYGSTLNFVAPGVNIKSAYKGKSSKYVTSSGTSMSAPFVTAAAAMLCLYHPNWDQEQILSKLNALAVDLGEEGTDDYYGSGVIIMPTQASQKIKTEKKKYTVQLSETKHFRLGATAQTKLFYESSNTKVVKVSKSGRVTVIGEGEATITISARSTMKYKSAVKKVKIVVK